MPVNRTTTRRVSVETTTTTGTTRHTRYGTVVSEIAGQDVDRTVKVLRVLMDDTGRVELHEESDVDDVGFTAYAWLEYDAMATVEDAAEALIEYIRDMGEGNDYWVDVAVCESGSRKQHNVRVQIGPAREHGLTAYAALNAPKEDAQ